MPTTFALQKGDRMRPTLDPNGFPPPSHGVHKRSTGTGWVFGEQKANAADPKPRAPEMVGTSPCFSWPPGLGVTPTGGLF